MESVWVSVTDVCVMTMILIIRYINLPFSVLLYWRNEVPTHLKPYLFILFSPESYDVSYYQGQQ